MDIWYLRIFSNTDTSDVVYKIGGNFYNGFDHIGIVRMTFNDGKVTIFWEEGEIGCIFPVNFEVARTRAHKAEVKIFTI